MKGDSLNLDLTDAPKRQFRSAPKVWQDIIQSIVNDDYIGEGITYAMIDEAVASLNHSITRESLRVKMARYIKSGYVRPAMDPVQNKRVRGAFWLTEAGKLFFNLESQNKGNQKQKTTVLQTPPSKWGQKALNIHPTVRAVR